ncbi:MAG TPA: FAD-linked oxidase C-terminal domain-containing protein [Vicinamibacterales bacterium]|nr:FAD-linked oxidase C-terminal domain-containing protein [Vicinamibacterales bacterium]
MSDALQRELRAALTGEVRVDRVTRALYATDASVYQIEPLGVVLPRSRDDVEAAVAIAGRHGVPITARGGGTSQAGQSIGAGLVLDTSKHLNRILEISPEGRWARVEPGVVLDDLNAALSPHGLRFAPDVSSSSRATVGGMMANNSSGARSVVYGKTGDHVRAQQVVLADGSTARLEPRSGAALAAARLGDSLLARAYREVPALAQAHAADIDARFPKVMRRVGGYALDGFVDAAAPVDLTRVMVGSEGTLGLVTEATVGLVPLPAAKALMTLEFDDLLDALGATPLVLTHGPSAVEVMDSFILGHAKGHATLEGALRQIVEGDAPTLLCVEFYGEHLDAIVPRMQALERDLQRAAVRCQARQLIDAAAQARVWHVRESSLGLSMGMKGDGKAISFVEDTAVPPERLRDYIARFRQVVARHGTHAGVYAHASVGCLHVRPVINLKTAAGVAQFEAIANDVADLVLEFGGALSGEHGDGLVRGAFNEKMFGATLYQAFRRVKAAFDPQGLFNPGRIVDTPPITAHLRFGPAYQTAQPATFFDFGADGGLGRAVENCSGVGLCRKTRGGTMCPSYMATRNEQDSTRGRANALRLALSGQLGPDGLDHPGLHDALDLCLECRACKSECPTSVDMARIKSEVLAGQWERHGAPLAARVFGQVRGVARIGSALAPAVNAVAASRLGRALTEALLDVDRRRTLPVWTRRTLSSRLRHRRPQSPVRALLFADTFTEHSAPDIGVAAFEVLDRAGLGAHLVRHGCCGRPLISQGLLDEARVTVGATVDALHDAAARGEAIVFLEPSCLSVLREDAPALFRGRRRERAQTVAGRSVLFEEYLEAELSAGRAVLPLRAGPAGISLHAHCHQRAMGLAGAAAALLRRIPGATVTDLDAGCCGMAGSFGYTRAHYDVSRAIGERTLLPAARALASDGVLVAAGTSCRHQVADFAAVVALHPAVLLRSLVEDLR